MSYMNEYGELDYDWVSTSEQIHRTPVEYPYSFDAYYIWRDFDKADMPDDVHPVYMDRMRAWDPETYSKSFKAVAGIYQTNRKYAETFIDTFYDGKYTCVGQAIACNHSTGYEIPIFFIKGK